jgi:hypothetical protein
MCIRSVKGRSVSDLLRRVIGLMRSFPLDSLSQFQSRHA